MSETDTEEMASVPPSPVPEDIGIEHRNPQAKTDEWKRSSPSPPHQWGNPALNQPDLSTLNKAPEADPQIDADEWGSLVAQDQAGSTRDFIQTDFSKPQETRSTDEAKAGKSPSKISHSRPR